MNRRERRAKKSRGVGRESVSVLGWDDPSSPARREQQCSRAWQTIIRVMAEHERPVEERHDTTVSSCCGHCGLVLDAATHVNGKKPTPGDLAICWGCAGVNQFGEDLTLIKRTEKEVAALDVDHTELAETQALVRAVVTGSHRQGRHKA